MAITITVSISDAEEACLRNDLLDIDQWVRDAVAGKISNCRKRMVKEWQAKLFNDPAVSSIPADPDALIALVKGMPGYKDRVQRQAEEDADRALAVTKAIAERDRQLAFTEAANG